MARTVTRDQHAVARSLVRFVTAALLTVVADGSWDVWWHGSGVAPVSWRVDG